MVAEGRAVGIVALSGDIGEDVWIREYVETFREVVFAGDGWIEEDFSIVRSRFCISCSSVLCEGEVIVGVP
jgi:hypothetical protein